MDEKTMGRIRELLGDDMLEKVTGGIGPDPFVTPDPEKVKRTALIIYESFGLEVAISYATTLLNCSRSEVEGWFSE